MPLLDEVTLLIKSDSTPSDRAFLEALPSKPDQSIELIAIHNPQYLTAVARERLFALTLPYTAKAFLTERATMDEEEINDHYQHTFGGNGVVCLAGEVCGEGGGVRVYAHANFTVVPVTCQDGRACTALYLQGICSDPDHQGKGLASMLLEQALPQLQRKASYLALRTMNLSVMKMVKRACHGNAVYPLDAEPTADIVAVATSLGEQLVWPSLVPTTLVIPKAYPPCLIPVFRPEKKQRLGERNGLEAKVVAMLDCETGDALVCIVPMPLQPSRAS